jgi:hypothetical protein
MVLSTRSVQEKFPTAGLHMRTTAAATEGTAALVDRVLALAVLNPLVACNLIRGRQKARHHIRLLAPTSPPIVKSVAISARSCGCGGLLGNRLSG